jgi:hypothetical protein
VTASSIELSADAHESAFACMMAALIRDNLADHPEKQRDFAGMRGRAALVAEDAEQTITLHFHDGRLTVHAGLHGIPDVMVRGTSEALIDLSRIPPSPRLPFLPDPRSTVTRSLARQLIDRRLRITGLTAHPWFGLRLSRVLSIYGGVTVNIEHNHQFAQDEAKARVQALADYMSKKHGMLVQWTGDDSFRMQGKYKVVSIDATITLAPNKIQVSGKDPGMLWRGPAKAYISKKLEQYLNPGAPVDSLSRG